VTGYTKAVYPQTVAHPSINRARRRITTSIETNALQISQITTVMPVMSCSWHLTRDPTVSLTP